MDHHLVRPVLQHVDVEEPSLMVAALIDAPTGPVLVYGVVWPWGGDAGPDPLNPKKRWDEHHRAIPQQFEEWRRLMSAFPGVAVVIAGDLNTDLGDERYHGTTRGRRLLRAGLLDLGPCCATETPGIPAGTLRHPPIDHVLVPFAWGSALG